MKTKLGYIRSIKSRLLATQALMLGILALAVGGISFYLMTTYIEKLRLSELHANAHTVAIRAYHFARFREEMLVTIAKSKAAEKYYKSYNTPVLNSYISQYANTFPVIVFESYENPDVTAFVKGKLYPKEFNRILVTSGYRQKPNKIYIGEPYYSQILDSFVIDIGYFYVNYFGDEIGPIFVNVQLDGFDSILKAHTFKLEGQIIIINAKGKIIYSSEHSWISKSLSEMPGTDDFTRLTELSNTAVPYRISFEESVVSVARIPELKWKVFVSVPMKIFNAPFVSLRNAVILASLTLIILGLIFTYLMGKKITSPINKLARVFENISETGDLTRHVSWKGDDELGRLAGSFNTMIEKLKEFNKKINDERQFTSSVINSMADSLIIVNTQGKIIKVNAAAKALLSFNSEFSDLSIKSIVADFEDLLSELQEKNTVSVVQDINFTVISTGVNIPVILSLSKMHGGDIVLVAKDNTERKRIEKIKNDFIATVSHELRTPLTSIMGSIGLIEGGVAGEYSLEMERLLNIANNNASRLLLIVNDILDIQKIESGDMVFNFEHLDIVCVIKKAITENIFLSKQNEIEITISHTEMAASKVYADESRLLQVMSNLLSNAIKFSPQNEIVSIHVSQNEGYIRIAVHNNGPGIPESFQCKVFDRFSQADSTDSRKNGGAGLGLSIAEMIVKQHQGTMGFTSSETSGTTFYFDLPEA